MGNGAKWPTPCQNGTIGTNIRQETAQDCEICPAGEICIGFGMTQPIAKCYPGHYCPEDRDNGWDAELCPEDTFCPAGSEEPTDCPDGTFRDAHILGIEENSCQKCLAGKYCEAGSRPQNCEAGFICLWGSDVSDPTDGDKGFECPEGTSLHILVIFFEINKMFRLLLRIRGDVCNSLSRKILR